MTISWQEDPIKAGNLPIYEIDGSDGIIWVWNKDGITKLKEKKVMLPICNLSTKQMEKAKSDMEELAQDFPGTQLIRAYYKNDPSSMGFMAIRPHKK